MYKYIVTNWKSLYNHTVGAGSRREHISLFVRFRCIKQKK